ncbi:hypothetical protein AgCh_033274 [Apium graveolens]
MKDWEEWKVSKLMIAPFHPDDLKKIVIRNWSALQMSLPQSLPLVRVFSPTQIETVVTAPPSAQPTLISVHPLVQIEVQFFNVAIV